MNDPFGSMQGFMQQFSGMMQNPTQYFLSKKLNLPQNINPMQDPQGAIQYLMNNGQLSQSQYNQLQQTAQRLMQNPQFQQFMGGQRQK